MAKKYVDDETKEQRKVRKALEKAQKSVNSNVVLPQKNVNSKYYVLCLKHGTKYSADYVNKLYNMVKRNCTLDYDFVCLTDDTNGLNSNILTVPLPEFLSGWWCKPYMFSNQLGLDGTILYLDLDVVIAKNIDHLFLYEPTSWCTIRDFTRKMRPSWQKYNSSVVRFRSNELVSFWKDFEQDQKAIQRRWHGDQDWLYDIATRSKLPAKMFPDNWILSWKWEIRRTKDFASGGPRGSRKLRTIEHVTPPNECCITVFHGDPQPHNCDDPWVKENWK